MARAIASVYRIDYEMSQSLWTVYIAGFNQEEAMAKLYSTTPGINKVNSVQHESRLDSVSNQLADEISKPLRLRILELEDALKKAKKVSLPRVATNKLEEKEEEPDDKPGKISSKIRIDK